MKKDGSSTKTRVVVLLVAAFILLASFLVIFLFNQVSNSISPEDSASVTVNTPGGGVLIVDSTGSVTLTNSSGVKYSDLWSRDKVNEFLLYLRAQYKAEYGSIVDSLTTDELLSLIEEQIENSSATPTPTGGVSEYFGTATPTPSPTPGGGSTGGGGGGTGGSGGSGGGGGGGGWQSPSWCRVWKLSYCADVITPSPAQTATPTPTSTAVATPLPPDCSHPGNQITGKTVIGGELCIPLPTP